MLTLSQGHLVKTQGRFATHSQCCSLINFVILFCLLLPQRRRKKGMLTFSRKKGQANRGYSIKLETDVNSQSKILPLFLLRRSCNKNDLILCSLRCKTCSLIPIFGRPCSATDARVTFTPQARSPEFSSPVITLAITHAATSKAASSFHLEPGQVLSRLFRYYFTDDRTARQRF